VKSLAERWSGSVAGGTPPQVVIAIALLRRDIVGAHVAEGLLELAPLLRLVASRLH